MSALWVFWEITLFLTQNQRPWPLLHRIVTKDQCPRVIYSLFCSWLFVMNATLPLTTRIALLLLVLFLPFHQGCL
jgi:hypothetical protein